MGEGGPGRPSPSPSASGRNQPATPPRLQTVRGRPVSLSPPCVVPGGRGPSKLNTCARTSGRAGSHVPSLRWASGSPTSGRGPRCSCTGEAPPVAVSELPARHLRPWGWGQLPSGGQSRPGRTPEFTRGTDMGFLTKCHRHPEQTGAQSSSSSHGTGAAAHSGDWMVTLVCADECTGLGPPLLGRVQKEEEARRCGALASLTRAPGPGTSRGSPVATGPRPGPPRPHL